MISIEVNKLFKSYKTVKALQDISFQVSKGELFGFIQPDRWRQDHIIKNPDNTAYS